jgi:hypothetical protein
MRLIGPAPDPHTHDPIETCINPQCNPLSTKETNVNKTNPNPPQKEKNMKIYTTGQIAKICQVAPRTVGKWFDTGTLKGYKIPGSRDRRIPEPNLISFMKEQGFPETMIPVPDTTEPITT